MVGRFGELFQTVIQHAQVKVSFEEGRLELYVECIGLQRLLGVLRFFIEVAEVVPDF